MTKGLCGPVKKQIQFVRQCTQDIKCYSIYHCVTGSKCLCHEPQKNEDVEVQTQI